MHAPIWERCCADDAERIRRRRSTLFADGLRSGCSETLDAVALIVKTPRERAEIPDPLRHKAAKPANCGGDQARSSASGPWSGWAQCPYRRQERHGFPPAAAKQKYLAAGRSGFPHPRATRKEGPPAIPSSQPLNRVQSDYPPPEE